MPFNPKTHERLSLLVPIGGRAELKRRTRNAKEKSVNAFCNSILFNGKVNHKKKP